MGCDFPIPAWRPKLGGRLVFNPSDAMPSLRNKPLSVPCGQCRGCRLARAVEWGIRCHHESQMNENNSFITLTFNDEHLPSDFSVQPRVFELMMKRLRERIEPTQIRFFGCGEYGGKTFRPHYHAIIFGYAFPDRRLHGYSKRGHPLFTSELLGQVWPYGFNVVGAVNWRTAAYTARYTLKKIDDNSALPDGATSWDQVRNYRSSYYHRLHPVTRQLVKVEPEFLRMSRMPGIGRSWAEKYKSDYFPHDFIVLDNKKFPVPDYYIKLLAEDEQKFIRDHRIFEGNSMLAKMERTDARRYAKKICRDARVASLQREEL